MRKERLHSCPELIDYINEIGFLPLLSMGVEGWSAEEVTDEDCQYTRLPDGGWEWPLWTWKGAILQESGCAYGKFFQNKAAFLRQVLPKQGGLHQPRVVARLLQLPPKRLPPTRGRKHRRKHPRHPADRRKPHHPRAAGGMWLHRAEDAEPLRRLPHPLGDGRIYRDGRFRLSPRPSRTGIWLGMVPAHHARSALRTRGLPPRPHAAGVAREDARPFPEDFARGLDKGPRCPTQIRSSPPLFLGAGPICLRCNRRPP